MDINKLKIAVDSGNIEWQRHALERMMERGISRESAKSVLISGEVIEDYPNDSPFPSALFLGWVNDEPLHVVVALDAESSICFIITVYKPDMEHFEPDLKTRREHGN